MIKALACHTGRNVVNVPLAQIKTNQVCVVRMNPFCCPVSLLGYCSSPFCVVRVKGSTTNRSPLIECFFEVTASTILLKVVSTLRVLCVFLAGIDGHCF